MTSVMCPAFLYKSVLGRKGGYMAREPPKGIVDIKNNEGGTDERPVDADLFRCASYPAWVHGVAVKDAEKR